MDDYPNVKKVYNDSLNKYNANIFQRNTIDDFRLSLELLLKEIFNNNKSLENQIKDIGDLLNNKDFSKEFTNMFHKLLDYYTKFNNDNIKHNNQEIQKLKCFRLGIKQ